MMKVIAHEIVETITDPIVFEGWLDASDEEIADKCLQQYGTYGSVLNFNGTYYYNFVGRSGTQYLLQALWKNGGTGCTFTNN